jgi:RNA polymerase sigma-70 factor, ECF subfamily
MPRSPFSAPPSDGWEETLAAARAGCPTAVGHLLEACRPLLVVTAAAACSADLQSKAGASDFVQESMLEGQRDFGAFRGQRLEDLVAWLRQILANNVANFRRHYRGAAMRNVRREVPLPAADSVAVPGETLTANTPGPAERVGRLEQLERLGLAIALLPEESRAVVVWRHHDQLSFEEIGRRLGRTPEGARQVWWRAVQRLRGQLQEGP